MLLKNFFKNPKDIGAVAESSIFLSETMTQCINKSHTVIEVGAGLGAFTKSIITKGIDPSKFWIFEINADFCSTLRAKFPQYHVISDDILNAELIIPRNVFGNVDFIVSGLPLKNFSRDKKHAIYSMYKSLLKPNGKIIQFTYGLTSPIDYKSLGLTAERQNFIIRNIPPAFVWCFKPQAA